MDILNSIIKEMTKEQVRFFKLFIARSHYHDQRLDESLFDQIRKSGDQYDEEKVVLALYKKPDKNSFYRLKNRLLSDVSKSLMLQHVEEDQNLYLLHLIGLSKYFLNKNHTKTALYFLKKAEAHAIKTENAEILDIIYGDFIRLSHEILSIDPEKYIKLRHDNHEEIRKLRTIDDILAVVNNKMKMTQNFSSDENPIIPLLEKTITQYSTDTEFRNSSTLRFKIYNSVSQILLQKRNYLALEDYLLKIFGDFTKDKLFTKNNHDVKLQMIVYIINTLFKNNKIKESLLYSEKLRDAMEEFNRLLYDKYLFFYYNSLVINFSKSDKDRTIEILEEMRTLDKIVSVPFYELFIYLNLAVSFFDKKDFHQSIRYWNKLFSLKGFTTTDKALQFKIYIAELIVRYELGDYDILENKIKVIKKEFEEYFSKKSNERDLLVIQILQKLVKTDNLKLEANIIDQINSLIISPINKEAADADILNYKNWISTVVKV